MDATKVFFRDKVVLITGASSGIGEELAWQLVHAEARVTLAARRKELLEAVATRIAAAGKPRPAVVECDVTRDGDLERAVTESVRKFGKLDVAIANAGFGVVGSLKTLSVEDYRLISALKRCNPGAMGGGAGRQNRLSSSPRWGVIRKVVRLPHCPANVGPPTSQAEPRCRHKPCSHCPRLEERGLSPIPEGCIRRGP
jgi:hypothetical protein